MSPRSLLLLVVCYRTPGFIGIKTLYSFCDLECVWTKIFFVNHSIVAHHERLDSSNPVLRRSGDERKAADHHSLDHEVQFPKWRSRSLTLENFEEVTVIRLGVFVVCPPGVPPPLS